jgi:hypothetical protein
MRDDQRGKDSNVPSHHVGRARGLTAAPVGGVPLAGDGALHADQAMGMQRWASNEAAAADSETGLILRRVAELQGEHAALDILIAKLTALPGVNDFELRRLKKRKLKVKDTIMLLQLQLEPDARA